MLLAGDVPCSHISLPSPLPRDPGAEALKSCVVEIPGAEGIEVPHLPRCHFPILPETTELRFEHGGSHKRCTIQHKQVPIEPGFVMGRIVVDSEGCSGTEPLVSWCPVQLP